MKLFEVGKNYKGRFACDGDETYGYTVLKRTEKSVTVQDQHGETFTRKVINHGWGFEELKICAGFLLCSDY